MIKAVIFDLNGIFIQSPRLSERFEQDFGIPVAEFIPKLSEIMSKVRHPNAGKAFEYWKPELEKWKIDFSEEEFWKYWFTAEVVSKKMISLAKELKEKDVKIFILSNNFRERADYYSEYPWMRDLVDQAYFSWQNGHIKPDVHAWLQILTEHNLQPEECIYFDDQEKNVTAAKSIGIHSYLFTTEENLKDIVMGHVK
jgi:HAD superfamily hydrolase (TIGR01509 family)